MIQCRKYRVFPKSLKVKTISFKHCIKQRRLDELSIKFSLIVLSESIKEAYRSINNTKKLESTLRQQTKSGTRSANSRAFEERIHRWTIHCPGQLLLSIRQCVLQTNTWFSHGITGSTTSSWFGSRNLTRRSHPKTWISSAILLPICWRHYYSGSCRQKTRNPDQVQQLQWSPAIHARRRTKSSNCVSRCAMYSTRSNHQDWPVPQVIVVRPTKFIIVVWKYLRSFWSILKLWFFTFCK